MKALYRKYRPKSLSEVIGQEQVTTPLKKSLKSGKIAHSYLFTGPRGTGKTSVARIIAHEINNFPYETEDSYLDIIEIDAASNTGVDNIRDLREKAIIAPSTGEYKVYIIDEVHMLSKSAFNALLKTLEEPPEHVVFILATTDLEKVPITITSRSQVFTFHLSNPDLMLPHLKNICEKEKIKIEEEALKVIISRGGGSYRDTLSLLDQISALNDEKKEITETEVVNILGLPKEKRIKALLNAYETQDSSKISSELKSMYEEGLKPELVAESIIKEIIKTPTKNTIFLLEDLPKVSAPFADAKLLLAMLKKAKFEPQTAILPVENQPPILKKPEPTKKPQTSKTPQKPEPKKQEQKSVPNIKDFSWQSFQKNITLANTAIGKQLEACRFKLSETSLDLYPMKKITKIILEKPQNFGILTENLPESIKLTIHNPDDYEKDPELAKISNIMGGGQEIDINSSPF